jgi:hypothetical protein
MLFSRNVVLSEISQDSVKPIYDGGKSVKVEPTKSAKFLKRMGKKLRDDLAWGISTLQWTCWKAIAYDYPSAVFCEFWESLPEDLKEFRALFCEWELAVPRKEQINERMGFDISDEYEIKLSGTELRKYWRMEKLARKFLEDMNKK